MSLDRLPHDRHNTPPPTAPLPGAPTAPTPDPPGTIDPLVPTMDLTERGAMPEQRRDLALTRWTMALCLSALCLAGTAYVVAVVVRAVTG